MNKIKIILLILISIFSFNNSKAFVIFEDITYEYVLRAFCWNKEENIQNIKQKLNDFLKFHTNNIQIPPLHYSILSEKTDDFKILLFLTFAKFFLQIRNTINSLNPYLTFNEKNNLTIKDIMIKGLIHHAKKEDTDGNTFLHIAAKNNKFEIIKFTLTILLKDEIQNEEVKNEILKLTNKTNNDGETFLFVAVKNVSHKFIKKTLKYFILFFYYYEDYIDFILQKNSNNKSIFDLLLQDSKESNKDKHVYSITIIILSELICLNPSISKDLAIKLIKTHNNNELIDFFETSINKVIPKQNEKNTSIRKNIKKLIQNMKNSKEKKQTIPKITIQIPIINTITENLENESLQTCR